MYARTKNFKYGKCFQIPITYKWNILHLCASSTVLCLIDAPTYQDIGTSTVYATALDG